jgi:hypothetical protein
MINILAKIDNDVTLKYWVSVISSSTEHFKKNPKDKK